MENLEDFKPAAKGCYCAKQHPTIYIYCVEYAHPSVIYVAEV